MLQLRAVPIISLLHIKSFEKQDNRWDDNGNYKVPESNNDLYASLI